MISSQKPLVFPCGSDTLVGIIHEAARPASDIGVLILVGGPQYRVGSHRQFILMARALSEAGFPVMRFDYRGMGDSEGDDRSFESLGDDIDFAVDAFVTAIPRVRRLVLWGLCDAASAALIEGSRNRRVGALILANPWVRTQSGEARAFVRHYYRGRLLQRDFWVKLLSGGINPAAAFLEYATHLLRALSRAESEATRVSFVDRMQRSLAEFAGPILLLISEHDLTAKEFMDLSSASPKWKRAIGRPNVRVVRVGGADHTFSRRSCLENATEQCRRMLEAFATGVGGWSA